MGLSLLDLPLPIKIVPAAPVSDDDLILFSRANESYRIEKNAEGEIVVMTPAGHQGARRELLLAVELERWAAQDKRGEVDGPNAGWNLPDGSTLSPDASWTERERFNGFTPEQRELFLPLCPDFVAEIRSRNDSIKDQQEEMERWIANGAQLGWLIDPYSAVVYIYRPGQQPETLRQPDVLEGEGPIAGFRLELGRFWA